MESAVGREEQRLKNVAEEGISGEIEWLKALIISVSINLLKLLKLWDWYHQKIYCSFLCPYPVVPPHSPPGASTLSQVAHQTHVLSGSSF